MIIRNLAELKPVFRSLYNQAEALLSCGKTVNVDIIKPKRTNQQNKYLWAVYKNIVIFWTETGFMPDNLDQHLKFINSDLLHSWFKSKYDVKTTTKFSTTDMINYVDRIQVDMTKQEFMEKKKKELLRNATNSY